MSQSGYLELICLQNMKYTNSRRSAWRCVHCHRVLRALEKTAGVNQIRPLVGKKEKEKEMSNICFGLIVRQKDESEAFWGNGSKGASRWKMRHKRRKGGRNCRTELLERIKEDTAAGL